MKQGTLDKSGSSEAEGIQGHLGSACLVSTVFPQIQKPVVETDMEQLARELEGLAQAQVRGSGDPVARQPSRRRSGRGGGGEARNAGIGEGTGTEVGD